MDDKLKKLLIIGSFISLGYLTYQQYTKNTYILSLPQIIRLAQ